APDMLHPSHQAVEYIWEQLSEVYLSDNAKRFIAEWKPIKEALGHKPFNPDSEEYRAFMEKTMLKVETLSKKYPNFVL
ncbi:MAG: GSCFA family protein, partial [Prevotella sp.]|nr:GSCFA family protein [Prevotella sp.]